MGRAALFQVSVPLGSASVSCADTSTRPPARIGKLFSQPMHNSFILMIFHFAPIFRRLTFLLALIYAGLWADYVLCLIISTVRL